MCMQRVHAQACSLMSTKRICARLGHLEERAVNDEAAQLLMHQAFLLVVRLRHSCTWAQSKEEGGQVDQKPISGFDGSWGSRECGILVMIGS